jgi:hypothetical protein
MRNDEIMRLPDGSGCFTMSFPLPADHWLTAPGRNEPPMPMRRGTDDPSREESKASIIAAARYAIRATTGNGTEQDFDPDAMVQNFVIGLLGYYTPDGLSHIDDAPAPPGEDRRQG